MNKRSKKNLILASVIVGIVLIGFLIFYFGFYKQSVIDLPWIYELNNQPFLLRVYGTSGIEGSHWNAQVLDNQDLQFFYRPWNGVSTNNPILPNSCYEYNVQDWLQGGGGTCGVALNGGYFGSLKQDQCNLIGGSWDHIKTSGQGCDTYICSWGSIDYSKYYVKSVTSSPSGLLFDFDKFKQTKRLNICNPTGDTINRADITLTLALDKEITAYKIENNNCTEIKIMASQLDGYFTDLATCQSNIIIPECPNGQTKCSDGTCKANCYNPTCQPDDLFCNINWTLVIIVLVVGILIISGFIFFVYKFILKKRRR